MSGLFNRLAVQTALFAIAVLVLVGIVLAIQVGAAVGKNEEDHYNDHIRRGRDQLQEQVTTFANLTETGAVVLSGSPELREAVAKRDVAAALKAATNFSEIVGTPFQGTPGMQLYDARGTLLVRAHTPLNNRQQITPTEVARVLRDGQSIGGVRHDELLGLVLSGVAAIRNSDGAIVGAIEVMSTIDSSFAMDRAKALGMNVAIFDKGGVVASSEGDLRLGPEEITRAVAAQQKDGTATVMAGAEKYLSAFVPLASPSGAELGYLYVGIDEGEIDQAIAATRLRMLRSVALATAAAAVLGWGASLLAIRPIQSLAQAARRIQANDLESAVPIAGPAEIRGLGEALDDMRLAIREGREAMLLANRDLAAQFDVSTVTLTEVTHDLTVIQAVLSHLSGERSGGLAGAAEELADLAWLDGVFVAVATEAGDLSVAAVANLAPGTADVTLNLARQRVDGDLSREWEVTDTSANGDTARLAAWGVGGVFMTPMLTPDGVAGVLAITSAGPLSLTERRRDLVRSVTREVAATLERTELQDEVDENRRIAEAVLREMSDGVLVVDQEGICRIANPAAIRLLGRGRADMIGQPWGAFIPLAAETLEALRLRAYHPTGLPAAPAILALRDRQLAVTSGPFPDPDPSRSGMLVLLRDLSAEAEAERVKQDFVSMVGHELRTPLTLIRTTIDLLFEGDAGALNTTQSRIVEVLRNNADRLMSLITDLLDMSALDSGRMQINPANVEIDAIVRGVMEDVQGTATAKQHSLRAEVPTSLTVWADAVRAQQILQNLVGNAIKYTPVGGVIEVRVREVPGGFVEVSVRDDGIGIPPEEQAHLFEKFYRTTAGRRTTGGTGLGLAIAKSFVELHGGQIWCESDGRSGSRFVFTLPRRRV
ncbi:MAG: HAMP domain-containing protein [Dehalococcoidia bacterium]|nr:MAG: HAMP domain-containing protein [Dehalococcoidia bacterium]